MLASSLFRAPAHARTSCSYPLLRSAAAAARTLASTPVNNPKNRKPKLPTAYTKRRDLYDEQLKALRHAFHHARVDRKRDVAARAAARDADLAQIRRDRSVRRREKNLRRVAEHRTRVQYDQQMSKIRADHGFQMWTAEQQRVRHLKMANINILNDAAQHWITHDTLDAAVERVVDDFFISTAHRTALAHDPHSDQQPHRSTQDGAQASSMDISFDQQERQKR